MEISSLQPTTTVQTTGTAAKISSDFDTFLKMLTTQMQNQDPLNPMDSSDYAVQLATFSGVEQQTRTNQLLSGLNDQFNLLGMAQLAGWVGNDARTAAPVHFDGTPVTVLPDPDARGDRTVLVVTNAGGTVVARDDLVTGPEAFEWLGLSPNGTPLPAGRYTLTTESYRGGEYIGANPVESYARVVEVQGGSGGNKLILAGGVAVNAADVSALRSATLR